MHLHSTHLDPSMLNLYAAAAAEKSAAAQHAAEVRKKLLSKAAKIQDIVDGDEAISVNQVSRHDAPQEQGRERQESRKKSMGDEDEGQDALPISAWA